MNRNRLILIAIVVVAMAVTAGLALRAGVFDPPPQPSAVGGAFQLVDQDGKPATEAVLEGRWSVVFFGFTYCPDICPTTLQTMGAAADLLGPKAKDLQVVFISVDPERDTPAQMKAYLEAQDLPVRTIGLTGTADQVRAATMVYRAVAVKVGEGPDYQVNHSLASYVMDPKGRFVRVLGQGMTPEQIADQLRKAMRGE